MIGIEIDSSRHQAGYDAKRDVWLRQQGWTMIRVMVKSSQCTGKVLLKRALAASGLVSLSMTKTHRTIVTPNR